jgi:hypothetical protein
MSIDAMKQALEALEKSVSTCFDRYSHEQVMSRPEHFINQTMTALRLAIEQAERQEPYGYFRYDLRLDAWVQSRDSDKGVPFYIAPPQRQPLTDEQIEDLYFDGFSISKLKDFARAVERAHGIGGGE